MKLLILFIGLITFAVCDELPFELERLNAQRDREIEKINEIYKKQLELLKVKYTKAGNLDAANQVSAIIDKLDPVKLYNLPQNDSALKNFIKDTTWKFNEDRAITFQSNGTLHKSWGVLEPEWKVKDMKVYSEGKVFVFNDDFKALKETTGKDRKITGLGILQEKSN